MKKSQEESTINLSGLDNNFLLVEQGIVPDDYNFYTETSDKERAQASIIRVASGYEKALGGKDNIDMIKKEIMDIIDINDFTDDEKKFLQEDPMIIYDLIHTLDTEYGEE